MPQVQSLAAASTSEPFVSVVVPIRNERAYIARCLETLLANDYPAHQFEVLVIDGQSTDGTPEIVTEIARREPRVRLLTNPHRDQANGLNIGIGAARGEIILRLDGHTTVEPNYIREVVAALVSHPEAWIAGGWIVTLGRTFTGQVVAAAMSSMVGVGNAMFRRGNYEGYVDTLAFGAYWRWVFDRIGLFDGRCVPNEDDELHYRVCRAGGKLFMTARVRTTYYARSTLAQLWKQYYRYGFSRVYTLLRHRRPATLRQVVPLMFVTAWLLLLLGTMAYRPLGSGLAAYAGVYVLALSAGAIDVARRQPARIAVCVPAAFAVLHFAYGIGGLVGILWFVLLRRKPRGVTPPEVSPSGARHPPAPSAATGRGGQT